MAVGERLEVTSEAFILCENLVKIYKVADLEVVALQGIDLTVQSGEMLALVGPSGSGKSTLMNILGGLDTPTAGRVSVGNYNLLEMTRREQVLYRRREVGFVWQQTARNLLPYLSAQENVELPMALDGVPARQRSQRARALLEQVGLGARLRHRPDRLSGGEQQRVAIAVAMANQPRLLLADEPTGEVDSEAAEQIFNTLRAFNRDHGVTIIIVTHDASVASRVDRVIGMRDGRTSTEIVRRRAEDGQIASADEYAIVDRAGRLQLPQAYLEKLGIAERARLKLRHDHVGVYPDRQNE
ncbi:MAG: ABC transporter [Candidatus Thermofonsia Clade 1 bacterium]|uniref:ABC transporter n=1 Tax=Candidatus Thermofonsia Clade 1 bacterium TaxID=2364210 RepID=A0A2M8PYA5_9CHLR|nr:MAG: ABC transporter [Candidatus Thermofonsia Clade 1 bacterium]PJF42527.1 MAG: ABC transporter [Candidatus Thermofonsia Clade 1 bacterium]RMF51526.1 MAG: ABC transporter ATP-binding protein [Chloroflexota bacterium]